MKVKFELRDEIGFFIEAETDFEEGLISQIFRHKGIDGYVKCGLTPAEIEGLRIYPANKEQENKQ